jgi:hypothetical protein
MNYKKHYDMLIERSHNRILEGYVEKHHIVPKCLGGSDNKDNIAILTPEEHFLAHQLLIKLFPGNRDLVYAVQLMTTHHTNARINNKLFGWLRKQMAIVMSAQTKKWLAENEHPKGFLGKTHSAEKKRQISESSKKAMIDAVGVKVYAYNLDGSFYKEYITLTECALDLKTNASNVKYTAEGNFGHCKQKQIRYEFFESIEPYVKPSPLKGKKKTEEHKLNQSKAMKGRTRSDEWKAEHSNAMKEYHARNKNI